MMEPTGYPHILLNFKGQPSIEGSRLRVKDLAAGVIYRNETAEYLADAYNCTMAQVHSALAYYYDHKEAIERELEEDLRRAEAMRPLVEDPVMVAKLKKAIARRKANAPA